MLRSLTIRWTGYILGLLVAANLLPEVVRFDRPQLIPIAALLLLLINTVIRPLFALLTLPISLLTMGVFTLFINAWMLMLSAGLLGGFAVTGFWGAVVAALLLSLVVALVNRLFGVNEVA